MTGIDSEIVKLVFEIGAPVLVTLVTAVLAKLLQYLHLQVSAEANAKVKTIVQDAILQAEEYVAAKVKATGIPATAGEKLQLALIAICAKLPNVTNEEATSLVKQELPKLGLGAAGFIQALREAASTPKPAPIV